MDRSSPLTEGFVNASGRSQDLVLLVDIVCGPNPSGFQRLCGGMWSPPSPFVRGKLRGSRAERGWQPPHVRAFHRPSQPIASAFQATMAWKRSGVRVP